MCGRTPKGLNITTTPPHQHPPTTTVQRLIGEPHNSRNPERPMRDQSHLLFPPFDPPLRRHRRRTATTDLPSTTRMTIATTNKTTLTINNHINNNNRSIERRSATQLPLWRLF
jgi:hypothetical protein